MSHTHSLPEGWKVEEWNKVLEIRSGRDYKHVENPNGKYPIIGSAGKTMGFADDYICEAGTTIVGRKGNINSPMFIEERFWNVDTAFGLHVFDSLFNRYLYYFCLSFNFTELDRGSGRPSLVKSDLKKVLIPIPPLEEQKQIVAILDDAFAAIEQAQANIEKNIENAKELFQSKLNDIFSQKGEGWEEKVWDDVLEIRSGRNQKQVLNSEGKYPILGSAGKVMGYADDFICEEYTTIVGRKGTINNPMLIKEKFWNVDTAFGLHAKDGLNKLYLFYFCRSFDFEKMDRGSGRPSLVKSDLLKIKMPVPSLENQQKIIKQLETLHDEITSAQELYKKKLTNLEDLKQSLLEQAFAGKLTHKDMPA
ncbi:restriction endonuclease subunit S [Psychrobacter submarinus]|uniref:restriction endonuclease subunit S n=1 Tax=Psychrobacter submarinus TaxID=154108 RepID=UPI00191AB1C7|nr:restriction endonuclease subunit S [Psychrobacter submarinus]